MRWSTARWLLAAFTFLAGLGLSAKADEDKGRDEGFKPLFNGTDLTGWKFRLQGDADPKKTFSVKDGMIVVTGRPNGFFYTDKSYKDYVLRFDWRYKRPASLTDDSKFLGNSGCLVHIHNPDKGVVGGVWPQCIEVQGMNLNHGMLLFLKAKAEGKPRYDRKAKDKATHKVGEWNTTEVTCKADGTIEAKINGTPVSSGKSDLTEGHIGFQSEGAELYFRNIKLKQRK